MMRRHGVTRSSAPGLAGRSKITHEVQDRQVANRRPPELHGSRGAVLIAPIVAALLAFGCGRQSAERTARSVDATPAAVVSTTQESVPSAPEPVRPQTELPQRGDAALSAESLPPEIVVSASDTLVAPGATVEFTVRGTSDVAEVVVWDGIGQRQALALDSASGVWRGFYRVPLGASRDRLGLSVTARTEANKWRRVWVFLKIQQDAPPALPEAPPGS